MSSEACRPLAQAHDHQPDAAGRPTRRLVIDGLEEGSYNLWLKYVDPGSDYGPALRRHLRGGARPYPVAEGEYRIPLGLGKSLKAGQRVNRCDVELWPVFPVRFRDKEGKRLTGLRDGWLYIYINGFLWREIHHAGFVSSFADVNLALHQGKPNGQRPATVESQGRLVVLPSRVNGEKTTIQICFSEVQWSWHQICFMGGMDEKDPRFVAELHAGKDYMDIEPDVDARAARMQTVELDTYRPDGDLDTLTHTFLAPVKKAWQDNQLGLVHLTPRSQMQPFPGRPLNAEQQAREDVESKLPVLALQDPLAIVADHLKVYLKEWDALKEEVERAKKEPLYEAAVLGYQIFHDRRFIHPEKIKIDECSGIGYRVNEESVFSDAGKKTSREAFRETLHVEARRKIRQRLREARREHVEWLRGRISGRPAKEIYPAFVHPNAALDDYFSLEGEAYGDGFLVVNGMIINLDADPAQVDRALDISQDIESERGGVYDDEGLVYLAELFSESHPLYYKLFPDRKQVDACSPDEPDVDIRKEKNDGTGKFRPGAFAVAYAAYKGDGVVNQQMRRGTQAAKEAVTVGHESLERALEDLKRRFMRVYRRMRKVAAKRYTLDIEAVVRLTKAQKLPALKGAHLVTVGAGKPVPKNLVVLHSGGSALRHLNNAERRREVIKRYKADTDFFIKDGRSGELLGVMAKKDAALMKGFRPSGSYLRLLQPDTADEATYLAKRTLLVVPEDSPMGRLLVGLNRRGQEGARAALEKAYKTLPLAVVGFELWNMKEVLSATEPMPGWRKKAEFAGAFLDLSYALAEATDRFITHGAFKEALHKEIMKSVFSKMTPLKLLGSVASFYSAFTMALDTLDEFAENDHDAAIALGVAAAGFAAWGGGALAMAAESALGGPLALAGALVVLLGVIAYAWLDDSELEEWAANGPFNGNAPYNTAPRLRARRRAVDGRPVERFDGLVDPRIAHEQLAGLLYAPTVDLAPVRREQVAEGIRKGDMCARVRVPLFIIGKMTLDLRVSASSLGRATLGLPRAPAQLPMQPYLVKQIFDDRGALLGFDYYYHPPAKARAAHPNVVGMVQWFAKVRLVSASQEIYPPPPPRVEKTGTGKRITRPGPSGREYEVDMAGKAPGWNYATSRATALPRR